MNKRIKTYSEFLNESKTFNFKEFTEDFIKDMDIPIGKSHVSNAVSSGYEKYVKNPKYDSDLKNFLGVAAYVIASLKPKLSYVKPFIKSKYSSDPTEFIRNMVFWTNVYAEAILANYDEQLTDRERSILQIGADNSAGKFETSGPVFDFYSKMIKQIIS